MIKPLLMVIGLLLAAPALADGLRWDELSRDTQATLAPLHGEWDQLPADRKARLNQRAEQFSQLPPAQQQELRERFQRWQALPSDQREQLRQRFEAFRRLPPAEQQALRQRWQALSPDEQARLKERHTSPQDPARMRFEPSRSLPSIRH